MDDPYALNADDILTDIAVRLDARPIAVPLLTGCIEIHFVPVFGTTRAFLSFTGRPLPDETLLRVPALGGAMDVPCHPHDGRLLSTRALSSLPPGTELAFADDRGWHRYTLWAAR